MITSLLYCGNRRMTWRNASLFKFAVLTLESTFEKINVLDLWNSINSGWAHRIISVTRDTKHRKYKKKKSVHTVWFDLTVRAGRCRNYRPRVSLVTSGISLIHSLSIQRSSLQAFQITTTLNCMICSVLEHTWGDPKIPGIVKKI